MNLAKTKFYKIVGLQDEKLFMYSDEVDMALRARKKDLKFGVTKNALAWHQHINPQKRSRRLPYSAFLIGRNKVYLAWKHFNFFYALFILLFQFIKASKETIQFKFKSENIQYNFVFCIGAIYGFFKIMKPPKWLKLN
jgi:GT2 family glycosyltransferase